MWLQIPPACFTHVTRGRCFLPCERRAGSSSSGFYRRLGEGSGLRYFAFLSSRPERAGSWCCCFPPVSARWAGWPARGGLAAQRHMGAKQLRSFPWSLHCNHVPPETVLFYHQPPTVPAARLGQVFIFGSKAKGWTGTAKIQAVVLAGSRDCGTGRPLPVAAK